METGELSMIHIDRRGHRGALQILVDEKLIALLVVMDIATGVLPALSLWLVQYRRGLDLDLLSIDRRALGFPGVPINVHPASGVAPLAVL